MLFYHYYEIKSGKHDKTKKLIIYILSFLRILLVLLPQNNWGTPEGNFTFNILKNIPFSIMGILLIYWTYNERNKNGLKHMSILIFFSFLFYAPVVILSKTIPAIRALMMPKTVAYLLIVILGVNLVIILNKIYNK